MQTIKLNQLFGCCRYVWNQSLEHCNQLYANGIKKPSYTDLTLAFITQAKRELIWLKDLASTPLQLLYNGKLSYSTTHLRRRD